MPNSAPAIVTAAEVIWATFPARASKSGCRAANRNPPPRRQNQGAGPAGGDGNRADRAPRCERSISASASARLPVCDARPLRTRFGSHRGPSPGSCSPHRSNVSDAAANLPALRGNRARFGLGASSFAANSRVEAELCGAQPWLPDRRPGGTLSEASALRAYQGRAPGGNGARRARQARVTRPAVPLLNWTVISTSPLGSRSRLDATVAGLGVVDLVRDGVVLAYDDAGSGYPALVFVHGAACNRRFWCQQVPRFSSAHRVVAVDLRGHGESDAPSERYTVRLFADDLASTCTQLRIESPLVIGHSLGGLVALDFASAYPDHVAAAVLIDPP